MCCCATWLTILRLLLRGVRSQTKYQRVINSCLVAVGSMELLIAMRQNILYCFCVVTIAKVVFVCLPSVGGGRSQCALSSVQFCKQHVSY